MYYIYYIRYRESKNKLFIVLVLIEVSRPKKG